MKPLFLFNALLSFQLILFWFACGSHGVFLPRFLPTLMYLAVGSFKSITYTVYLYWIHRELFYEINEDFGFKNQNDHKKHHENNIKMICMKSYNNTVWKTDWNVNSEYFKGFRVFIACIRPWQPLFTFTLFEKMRVSERWLLNYQKYRNTVGTLSYLYIYSFGTRIYPKRFTSRRAFKHFVNIM